MNAREMKKTMTLGNTAGRKWAEDGRSIAAVEAVNKWCAADRMDDALFKAMVKEIGDDDEFAALKAKSNHPRSELITAAGYKAHVYRGSWYGGVCEVFEKWNNNETK
jgi:hypothetical protein